MKTKIQWADYTWNPWRGCTKVSPGCAHCYAETLVTTRMRGQWGKGAPRQRASLNTLNDPFRWNKKPWVCGNCGNSFIDDLYNGVCPLRVCSGQRRNAAPSLHRARVFCLSLGDWLDSEVNIEWLVGLLDTIRQCRNLDWLLCTKRPELFFDRLRAALNCHEQSMRNAALSNAKCGLSGQSVYRPLTLWLHNWMRGDEIPQNVWALCSVENQEALDNRIKPFLKIPAIIHGLSCEPLLGPLDLTSAGPNSSSASQRRGGGCNGQFVCNPLTGEAPYYNEDTGDPEYFYYDRVNWIIAGGESGPGARPCQNKWLREIISQCAHSKYGFEPSCLIKQSTFSAGEVSQLQDRKGGDPSEWPTHLNVRQFPK